MSDKIRIYLVAAIVVLLTTFVVYANEHGKLSSIFSGKLPSFGNIFKSDITLSNAPELYDQVCDGHSAEEPMSIVKAKLTKNSDSSQSDESDDSNESDNSNNKDSKKDDNKKDNDSKEDEASIYDKIFKKGGSDKNKDDGSIKGNDNSKDNKDNNSKNNDSKKKKNNDSKSADAAQNYDAGAGGQIDDNGGYLFREEENTNEEDNEGILNNLDGNSSDEESSEEDKDSKDDDSTDVQLIMLSGFDEVDDNSEDIKKELKSNFKQADEYVDSVVKNINDNCKENDNIILAGYSLGGSIAQKVASSESIANKYNVIATVTFGAPASSSYASSGINRQLCDKNDIVTSLDSSGGGFFDIFSGGDYGTIKEDGGYKDNQKAAHVESYSRDDVWGKYDALGKKNGKTNICFNKGDVKFFECSK